ncbi:unnamed protein product, partial [Allacma fusca]
SPKKSNEGAQELPNQRGRKSSKAGVTL